MLSLNVALVYLAFIIIFVPKKKHTNLLSSVNLCLIIILVPHAFQSKFKSLSLSLLGFLFLHPQFQYLYPYIYTNTQNLYIYTYTTHIYLHRYIYIYIEREREKESSSIARVFERIQKQSLISSHVAEAKRENRGPP